MWKPPSHCDKGIAALPITLSIMGIVLLVSVTLALVGFSDIFTSKSSGEAKEAFYTAELGAQDGLIRLSRGVTSSSWYRPEATVYPNLYVGINDVGSDNMTTPCNEATPITPNCSTCSAFNNNQTACQNKEGCSWSSPNCTGTPTVTTKVICSQAQMNKDTPSEKKAVVQVVTDVDSKGIVTQCSWDQI